MNLTLRQLRAFVAVAEAGSFTQAARGLHLTQSALSVLVRELERELGVQLLDRHTRQVLMTEAGQDFLASAQRLLGDLAGAVAGITELRDKRRGVLRLAAPQLMACTLMPKVIAAFHRHHPGVDVRLSDTLPEHLLDGLYTGQVELAVGQDMAVDEAIECRVLLRDRHWLVCPPSHPLAARSSIRWRELSPWPLIAPTRDFRSRIAPELPPDLREWLQRQDIREVSYMSTAIGMVASGLGLTVCPAYSAPLVNAWGLAMVRLTSPDFDRDVCLYTQARRSLSPAAAAFVDLLVNQPAAQPRAKVAKPAAPSKSPKSPT